MAETNSGSETLKDLPKGHAERNKVARNLRDLRSVDSFTYETGRDGIQYVRELQGVQSLFQYVKALNSSDRILDIGAGGTRGIRDLAKSPLGEGLSFEATVLTAPEVSEWTLEKDKIHITSAELLKGIEDESVGGALGALSVAYSEVPAFAVRGINRVLVPGGVFKGSFPSENGVHSAGLKRFHTFQAEFEALGYNTAFLENINGDVFLAIKPGGPNSEIDATTLLQMDSKSTVSQTIKLLEMKRQEEEAFYSK